MSFKNKGPATKVPGKPRSIITKWSGRDDRWGGLNKWAASVVFGSSGLFFFDGKVEPSPRYCPNDVKVPWGSWEKVKINKI